MWIGSALTKVGRSAVDPRYCFQGTAGGRTPTKFLAVFIYLDSWLPISSVFSPLLPPAISDQVTVRFLPAAFALYRA